MACSVIQWADPNTFITDDGRDSHTVHFTAVAVAGQVLCMYVTCSEMVATALLMLPTQGFPRLRQTFLKHLLRYWSTGLPEVRVLALVSIRRLAIDCPYPFLPLCLKVSIIGSFWRGCELIRRAGCLSDLCQVLQACDAVANGAVVVSAAVRFICCIWYLMHCVMMHSGGAVQS